MGVDPPALVGDEVKNMRDKKEAHEDASLIIIRRNEENPTTAAAEKKSSIEKLRQYDLGNEVKEKQQQIDNSDEDAGSEITIALQDADAVPQEGDHLTNYLSGFPLFALLVSTALIYFVLLLDTSIISTAVPKITSEFHSLPDVGWYAGVYQLTSSVLQPLTGKIYTYFPTKWTVLTFFAVFELGSLLCAVSTSSAFFIAGRAIAGVGVSGLQNGTLVLISAAVPLEKRAFYVGLLIGIGQLGLVIGPLIGGLFTQYVTWRWCFYVNLPLGAVAGGSMALLNPPEQIVKPPFSLGVVRKVIPKLDIGGFLLFAPAATLLLLALQYGSAETYAWNSSVVIGLFVGAGVAAVLFLLWEWRAGEVAIIPFSMVRKRVVWASVLQYVGLISAIFVGTQYFPLYFQAVKGVGPVLSGVYLLPSILAQVIFVIVCGALISKVGYYIPFAILGGVGVALGSGLISTWGPNTQTGIWIGYQIIYGIRGAGIQLALVAIQNALPPKQSALGTSFLVFCQTFTGAIFIVVGNTIFTQTLISETRRLVPSVDPVALLRAGGSAQAVRDLVPPNSPELAALLRVFSNAFDTVCYLMIALGIVSTLASFGMGWVDIRKKKPEVKQDVEAKADPEANVKN